MRTRDIHDLGFSCFANIDIYIYRIIRFGETWEIRSWKKVSIFLVSSRKRSITGKRYHPILNGRTIVCQHLEFVRIEDRNEAKLEPLEILGIPMNSRVTRYFRESLIISENSLSNTRNTFARQLRFFQRKRFSTIFARSKQQWFLSRVMQIFFWIPENARYVILYFVQTTNYFLFVPLFPSSRGWKHHGGFRGWLLFRTGF